MANARCKTKVNSFTPLESPVPLQGLFVMGPAIYGRDEIYQSLVPIRKGGLKAPSFLTGFTVIEVVMVIVLLAIMIALAIPRFDSFYSIKLEGAARKLLSDIRYTQRLALGEHDSYGVEFDLAVDTYRVYRVSDNSTAIEPLSRSNFIMDYTANSEFQGIDLSAADFAGTNKVIFTSLGIPQDGNGVSLVSAGTVTLSYRGSTKSVSVTPNTGLVSLQ